MTAERPPELLAAGDVSLVRFDGSETDRLFEAVRASIAHLRPWMPWAQGEPNRADTEEFVARSVSSWAADEAYGYWLSLAGGSDVVGAAGLHRRVGEGGLEIGYWVHASWTRRGVASAAAAALTSAGLALSDVDRIEIRCDEANRASAAVPARLGYRLDRIVDDAITAPGERGRCMVWVIDEASWVPPAST